MPANELVQLGRAKNAVLTFFEQRLSIPKIYIDADWDGHKIDVLAINRDGVGDLHAALLFPRQYYPDGTLNIVHDAHEVDAKMKFFASFPAHFKYIVAVDVYADLYSRPFGLSEKHREESFATDGIGRIGFLRIAVPDEGDTRVEVDIKPERFRASIAIKADEYIRQHEADWEIRA
jgi:hypothetical protein